jgi:hypothetical protein
MGFEDEVEQSIGRPCRQSDGGPSRHAASKVYRPYRTSRLKEKIAKLKEENAAPGWAAGEAL